MEFHYSSVKKNIIRLPKYNYELINVLIGNEHENNSRVKRQTA